MQIDKTDPAFNVMQNVKRHMFALRNGVVADAVRRAGDPHRIIFGLTLPDLMSIASVYASDTALADMLWANITTRESRLLAPMLYNRSDVTKQKGSEMIKSVLCTEEADILCHRLLRHLPEAWQLVDEHADSTVDLERYAALRLAFNLMMTDHRHALAIATAEATRNCPLTVTVANQLITDIKDIFGDD